LQIYQYYQKESAKYISLRIDLNWYSQTLEISFQEYRYNSLVFVKTLKIQTGILYVPIPVDFFSIQISTIKEPIVLVGIAIVFAVYIETKRAIVLI